MTGIHINVSPVFCKIRNTLTSNFSSSWVIRVARFTINNLDEFAFDRYASHIIRTCLQCAAGVRVAANVARSKKATPAAKTDDKSDEQAWISYKSS